MGRKSQKQQHAVSLMISKYSFGMRTLYDVGVTSGYDRCKGEKEHKKYPPTRTKKNMKCCFWLGLMNSSCDITGPVGVVYMVKSSARGFSPWKLRSLQSYCSADEESGGEEDWCHLL